MSGEESAPQMALVESPHVVSSVKLHILKKGEYTLWSMRMEQYLTNTDYALWQVIINGDEPVQTTKDENGVETKVSPKTAQALLQRQRERKAKSILLLAILDEYQLRLHGIKDAKTPWAAIKSRFGSNVESKKMQKNVLKQNFENFSVSDTEGLDKAYDRFQKLISLQEVHGAAVSNEDANQKFLRALPSSWNNVALIMRNKTAYQLGLESVEAQLVVHQKNKAVYEEKIAVLEFEVKDKGNAVTRLTNQLEQTLKEKEDLKAKLEQFETSFKNLNKLINSQISSKDKTGLGYGDQLNENDSSGSELFKSVFDSRSSDGDDNQTNDMFKKGNEYHVVPPPLTGNYLPPLADLSFAGLDDSVYRPTANKTSASVSQVETSITLPSNTSVEMPRVESVRNEPVKSDKQAVKPRMVTQSPKVDRKDWNGKMTQKLGLGFGSTKKAYFVCGSYSHLIKDCDFHEKRMAKKSVLQSMGKNTSHREVRPIWNNTQRINHQNKFVPTAVLTRSGRIPVSTAKQHVNTATHKNRVNVSKSKINTFPKTHSSIRRSFYKSTVLNTRVSKEKVNTVRVNGVNTAGQTAVSTVKGNGVTAVKASAGCVWRPKMTDLNNGSKDNSGSWISKRGNPQQALKYKGMFDSGCSRHMTGNKALLTDYQDIDGGFVAFGGSTRGGKITVNAAEGVNTASEEVSTAELVSTAYWYQTIGIELIAFRNLCKKILNQDSAHMVAASKFPLKPSAIELWRMMD
ncbi:hypothetical protein Tco_0670740 [Tanacetum coccineum]